MSNKLNRRDFAKTLAAGAAALAAGGAPRPAAAIGGVPYHGPVVTYAPNRDFMWDCYARGGYNLMKYVTGWGSTQIIKLGSGAACSICEFPYIYYHTKKYIILATTYGNYENIDLYVKRYF